MEQTTPELKMTFMPSTIEHLGARLYSTIPPIIAELVANSLDADAHTVRIQLQDVDEKRVIVSDDGIGMSFDDINNKFLRIGRNRRLDKQSGGDTSPSGRLVIGKKGLGKLSFFGLANKVTVSTIHHGYRNTFSLDWNDIIHSGINIISDYQPQILECNIPVKDNSGTVVLLDSIKRSSKFNAEELANSLSRFFIFDSDVDVIIEHNTEPPIHLDNSRRYATLEREFSWNIPADLPANICNEYSNAELVTGCIFSTKKPISPSTHLRGITLFSRGKLVNLPEFFSESTSSHFYSYVSGWLEVNFIDNLSEDVIDTNRQSLNWENDIMRGLRTYLRSIVGYIRNDWRRKRTEKQEEKLKQETGINLSAWESTIPSSVNADLVPLLNLLKQGGEHPENEAEMVRGVKHLYNIVPPYPLFHWRHLHNQLKNCVWPYYQTEDYYGAVFEGCKLYIDEVSKKSAIAMRDRSLLEKVFKKDNPVLRVTDSYLTGNNSFSFTQDTLNNMEDGHRLLSVAMWEAFRCPIAHEQVNKLRDSGLFSEQDCLDALSILSHLFHRLEYSTHT